MNDAEKKLQETLKAVADSTTATHRDDPIVEPVSKQGSRIAVLVAGFALVVAAIGLPAMLGNSSGNQVGGTTETSLPEPETTLPEIVAPTSPEPEFVIDPDWFVTTPDDVELVKRHLLRSNAVWCFFEGGASVGTRANWAGEGDLGTGEPRIPVDADLNFESYLAACRRSDASHGAPLEGWTVCRGVLAAAALREWFDNPEDGGSVIDGQLGNGPGFPVFLGWDSDCVSENLPTNVPTTLTNDLDMDLINQTRRFEIALTAASVSHCWTYNEALAVAAEAKAKLGDEWVLVELGFGRFPGCFYIRMDIDYAWIWLEGVQVGSGPDNGNLEPGPGTTTTTTRPTGS